MNIGILGSGSAGQSLARVLLQQKHDVMISSRNLQSKKAQNLAQDLGVQIGTVADTIAFGKIVVIAVRGESVADVINQGDWSGKIVIDMTNNFAATQTSWAQNLAQKIPGASVVKTLNILGVEHFTNPDFNGQSATMFIAGDSASSKQVVSEIIARAGFDVIDTGNLSTASHLEALAAFWVHLAYQTGQGRNVAFKLIRK